MDTNDIVRRETKITKTFYMLFISKENMNSLMTFSISSYGMLLTCLLENRQSPLQ